MSDIIDKSIEGAKTLYKEDVVPVIEATKQSLRTFACQGAALVNTLVPEPDDVKSPGAFLDHLGRSLRSCRTHSTTAKLLSPRPQ